MRSGRHSTRSLGGSSGSSVGEGSFQNGFSETKSASTSGSKKGVSRKSRSTTSSKRHSSSGPKDFLKKLVDRDAFNAKLHTWLEGKFITQECGGSNYYCYDPPFEMEELRQFDFAMEGVLLQQLLRMPQLSSLSTTTTTTTIDTPTRTASDEADICLVVQDFLYTSVQAIWETFWTSDESLPFFVTGSNDDSRNSSAVSGSQCAALVGKTRRGALALWEHLGLFVLVKPDLSSYSHEQKRSLISPEYIGQAVFYGLHMLLSRRGAKSAIRRNKDTAYIALVDSSSAVLVRLEGDVSNLDVSNSRVYETALKWVEENAQLAVSNIHQVWNRFGNANWGDEGALHLLLAIFYCIEQVRGRPRKAISELASQHNARLHQRKIERRVSEAIEDGRKYDRDGGIEKEFEGMKIKAGAVLWVEDSQGRQKGFRLSEDHLLGGSLFAASSLDDTSKHVVVYVGAHRSDSDAEPSWEDMGMWYRVQRQSRVLNTLKQRGVLCEHLPEVVTYGRLLLYPQCGIIPILITSPIGETLETLFEREGVFSSEEILRCCHDCLIAFQSASSAGVSHGNITPQHIIRIANSTTITTSIYVVIEWGRAVLEDRDSPAINLQFSSTHALQQGKLCPVSDAESLVYLLYFLCGGITPQFDSIESALQWREQSWAQRLIQQKLGDVSAVLKAFSDYVDSLCGTPYPVDYEIWLQRLTKTLDSRNRSERSESSNTFVESSPSSSLVNPNWVKLNLLKLAGGAVT